MRTNNNKEIVIIYHNNKPLSEIRMGLKLVWAGILGCFGKGYWRNLKPWINKESWKNK